MPRLLTILLAACTGSEGPSPGTPTIPTDPDGSDPLPLAEWTVDLPDRQGDGTIPYGERTGRMLAAMEAQLYRSVVPDGPAGRPVAVEEIPESVSVQLSFKPHADGSAEVSLCLPDGICEIHFASGTPEDVGTSLASQVLAQLGDQRPVLECLSRAPSKDEYASMMTGRSAAVSYGWRARSESPGDVRLDPIARAVFLDPRSPTGQWLAGRAAWARGDRETAALHLYLAARLCPDHDGFAADEAKVFAAIGDRRGAFPDDPRFVFSAIDASLQRGKEDTYARALMATARWPEDPRLERRAADAADDEHEEPHLVRWASLDPRDPEPVRRLAKRVLVARDWPRLLTLCDELERRGVDASDWRVPALLALGMVDEAAKKAPANLAPRIAARAGAMPTGSSVEERLLRAHRLLEEDPGASLELAEGVLEQRPYWPEALRLAATAARSAKDSSAPRLEARLAEVEP